MARLRLGYTKSRTGCTRCKARRVKCDETKPSCKACVRHGIECSLSLTAPTNTSVSDSGTKATPSPGATPNPPASIRRSRARPSDRRPGAQQLPEAGPSPASAHTLAESESPAAPPTPDPFPYLAKFVTGAPEQDTATWVFDLELLHHFTTSTYRTFSLDGARDHTHHLWQVEVPKQAFVHVFLLHQILAISASHLAHLHPHSRQAYSLRASQHQSHALRGMRVALANITPDNCHALFAAASLLFITSLATSSNQDTPEGPTVDELADIFLLIKGVNSVLNSSQDLLRSGPLASLFTYHGGANEPGVTLSRVIFALNDFLVHLVETKSDEGVRRLIRAEVDRLVTAIQDAVARSMIPEYRVVAVWPILMSDELLPLLRQRNQAALALLSYYCVVLHAAELQGYWFMRGWAAGVMRDISKTMTPPWNRHSAWALGWISGQTNFG
ncbi:hypothetical protein VTK26DRAFT_3950 [Humicola hyalothermophila]